MLYGTHSRPTTVQDVSLGRRNLDQVPLGAMEELYKHLLLFDVGVIAEDLQTELRSLREISLDSDPDEEIYDSNDCKPLPDDKQKLLKTRKNEQKRTYHPMQECLAERILSHIKGILWLYSKKKLSDFNKFDFQIYTARFCMLEEQTLYRLLNPEAACFHRDLYDDFKKLQGVARVRVSKYQAHKAEHDRSEELQRMAKEEPDTLFLIIADEAHWGVGKAEKHPTNGAEGDQERVGSKSGANDRLINCWTDEYPNVIVLLVTATGYNLKSEESRLPNQMAVLLKESKNQPNDQQMGQNQDPDGSFLERIRLVKKTRNVYEETTEPNIVYPKWEVEREFFLHNIKWAEAHLDHISDGVIVKFRRPTKQNEDCQWMVMSDTKNEFGVYGLTVTNKRSEAMDLLIKGEIQSGMKISTTDDDYILVVMEKKESGINKYGLGFIHSSNLSNVKYYHFSLKMECGEDVIVIQVVAEEAGLPKEYLHYQRDDKTIILGRPPPAPYIDGLPSYHLEYSFLIEHYRSPEQLHELASQGQLKVFSKPAKQYLSLNYYYNSMRNKQEIGDEKLIRGDEMFLEMLRSARRDRTSKSPKQKKPIHSNDFKYLAADYSYFIILMDIFQNFPCSHIRSLESVFRQPAKVIEEFTRARNQNIETFVSRLEHYKKTVKLDVISPEIFIYVRNYYSMKCMYVLEYLCKTELESDPGNLFEDILNCLLFLDFTDETVSERWTTLSEKLNRNKDMWKELDRFCRCVTSEDFEKWKRKVLEKCETFKIINTVLSSSTEDQDGKMVVVRLQRSVDKQIPPGNIFYATLCIAREVADDLLDNFRFEIIRDFGRYKVSEVTEDIQHPQYRMHYKLQPKECEHRDKTTLETCSRGSNGRPCNQYSVKGVSLICMNCHHKHRDVSNYEHLNTLPCILILVSKGRLGDTFPESFFAMDCRLSYDSQPYLSTVMQEFGRLCRYMDKLANQKPPYILIGSQLNKFLSEAVEKFADFRGHFVEQNLLDPYMCGRKPHKKTKQSLNSTLGERTTDDSSEEISSTLKTKKSHADYGNKEKHDFRILLEAEPQIGKTGVYLKLISLLRQAVEGNAEEIIEYDDQMDTSSEEEDGKEDEECKDEERVTDDSAEKWKYPYWKQMERTLFKDIAYLAGKYARTTGSKSVAAVPHSKYRIKQPTPSCKKVSSAPVDIYRTYSIDDPIHQSCTKCRTDVGTVQVSVSVLAEDILISIPTSKRYLPFLKQAGLDNVDITYTSSFTQDADTLLSEERTLQTWIVTPSYRRFRDATLNYNHTMVTEDGRKCNFQHFIFVRESEFSAYCSSWDRTHVIVQLPNTMAFGDETVSVELGGIGYSRCFIQRFANQFDQTMVFMIDDNITSVHEIQTKVKAEKECIVRKGKSLIMVNVPLFSALKHMEKQFTDSSNLLDLDKIGQYENYPHNYLEPIKQYIGPDDRYGVTGMLKDRRGILRVKHSFKKTHVFSLVLINLQALATVGLEYEPLASGEDISLNKNCDSKKLWVCKYNRFLLRKRNLRSNIVSPIFCWPDDIVISLSDTNCEPSDSLQRMYHWIRWYKPPARVELYPKELHSSDVQSTRFKRFLKLNEGDHHLVIFVGKQAEHLTEYFHNTRGIGGYERHLIILSRQFCKEHSLKKKCDFKICCIRRLFSEVQQFEIYSSHNVQYFEVSHVMLYIEGKIDSPKDEERLRSVNQLNNSRTKITHKALNCKEEEVLVDGGNSTSECRCISLFTATLDQNEMPSELNYIDDEITNGGFSVMNTIIPNEDHIMTSPGPADDNIFGDERDKPHYEYSTEDDNPAPVSNETLDQPDSDKNRGNQDWIEEQLIPHSSELVDSKEVNTKEVDTKEVDTKEVDQTARSKSIDESVKLTLDQKKEDIPIKTWCQTSEV
ncbi:hypothetical protein LSH36_269g08046 [Paralvinella palmiformis]|uniref:Uncharacterized protein n=1 Tax=Paralvinella palmiformis TaxID=53620 RepID=A0AAD9JK20_9ANNE|nr:hypothetical protein LSH36_269g08046 [Paralvinella palmiformis]